MPSVNNYNIIFTKSSRENLSQKIYTYQSLVRDNEREHTLNFIFSEGQEGLMISNSFRMPVKISFSSILTGTNISPAGMQTEDIIVSTSSK